MIKFEDIPVVVDITTGEYTFEVLNEEGEKYESVFYIIGERFQVTYPNGGKENFRNTDIMRKHNIFTKWDSNLTAWLYMCLGEALRLHSLERYKPLMFTIKVPSNSLLECDTFLNYKIEFVKLTGAVKIKVPSRTIICKRIALTDYFPDVSSFEGGKVYSAIIDMLALSDPQNSDVIVNATVKYEFNNTIITEFGFNKYIIDYNEQHDTVLLTIFGRTIMLDSIHELDSKAPELKYLHEGIVRNKLLLFIKEQSFE